MPLNLEHPGDHQFIRSITEAGIRVGEELLQESFILTPDQIYPDWPVHQIQMLTTEHMKDLLELSPELVVLGTGAQQAFPATQILLPLLQRGIGVEVMNTDAACRTFNICVQENRRVVAGFMLPTKGV